MVNTFLVCSDFRENARQLNSSRLGKQRVEAFQILTLIENLRLLSELFQDPPLSPLFTTDLSIEFKRWIARIVSTYKSLNFQMVLRRGIFYKYLPEQVEPGDRLIKMGFANHPCVRSWYGYETALKSYINACIEEWISRGYKNTMTIYDIPSDYPRPSWTFDPEFHQIHRAALLHKEISRKEKPWYQLKEEFITAGKFVDYIWP